MDYKSAKSVGTTVEMGNYISFNSCHAWSPEVPAQNTSEVGYKIEFQTFAVGPKLDKIIAPGFGVKNNKIAAVQGFFECIFNKISGGICFGKVINPFLGGLYIILMSSGSDLKFTIDDTVRNVKLIEILVP